MKLSELKNEIEKGLVLFANHLYIFEYTDNDFLVKQYIHEIAKIKQQYIQFVDSFEELIDISSNENVFGEDFDEKVLKVLVVDTFDELANESMMSIKDSIVICNKIAKEVEHSYENFSSHLVKFPKLEPWQVKDYIKVNCKGLDKEYIDKLYDVTNGDIYRIENEIGKIGCFPMEKQKDLFKQLLCSDSYNDISRGNIFSFINAIIKRDMTSIGDFLRNIHTLNIDAIGLTTILHNNIKNIIDIQLNNKATPESLGMSLKQFKAIEYNCGKFSKEQLIKMLSFLNEIDFKLKSGGLDISNDDKIDYIVLKMLER